MKLFLVGKFLWGVDLKIDEDMGEILMKVFFMMKEYYKFFEIMV